MPDRCSDACGHCGMCTAAYERDDSDSFFCEYAADLARWEQQRMQQEASEAETDDDEEEGAPF